MLNNLLYIFDSPVLLIPFMFFATMGLSTFFVSLKLCGINDSFVKGLKYIFALISIGLTSNFFIMLIDPIEFNLLGTGKFVAEASLFSVLGWCALYEIYQLVICRKFFCKSE